MRRSRRSRADRGGDRGAAVVDFVLVCLVLVPLVLGLIQVGLVFYVRNTLTAAATEGARYASALGRSPADGSRRTREQLAGVLAARFVRTVSARDGSRDGLAVVEVRVSATVPPLGLWGPGFRLTVEGHGVREPGP